MAQCRPFLGTHPQAGEGYRAEGQDPAGRADWAEKPVAGEHDGPVLALVAAAPASAGPAGLSVAGGEPELLEALPLSWTPQPSGRAVLNAGGLCPDRPRRWKPRAGSSGGREWLACLTAGLVAPAWDSDREHAARERSVTLLRLSAQSERSDFVPCWGSPRTLRSALFFCYPFLFYFLFLFFLLLFNQYGHTLVFKAGGSRALAAKDSPTPSPADGVGNAAVASPGTGGRR